MSGEYDGLYAVLVCRVVLGRSFLTEKPGDRGLTIFARNPRRYKYGYNLW